MVEINIIQQDGCLKKVTLNKYNKDEIDKVINKHLQNKIRLVICDEYLRKTIIKIEHDNTCLEIKKCYLNGMLISNKQSIDISNCFINTTIDNVNKLHIYKCNGDIHFKCKTPLYAYITHSNLNIKFNDTQIYILDIYRGETKLVGRGNINELRIADCSFYDEMAGTIDKLNCSYVNFLTTTPFYYCNIKSKYINNTNINFDIKDPITIYKKVSINYENGFKDFGILIGKTYKNSKIINGGKGKYRTDKCKFTKIVNLKGEEFSLPIKRINSLFDYMFKYELNKKIEEKDFNERQIECAKGIHFYLTFEEALNH